MPPSRTHALGKNILDTHGNGGKILPWLGLCPYMALELLRTADAINLTLRYEGPGVDSGSMAIEDVLEAPQGFAGAYGSVDETFGLAKQGVIVLFSTMSKVAFQLLRWSCFTRRHDGRKRTSCFVDDRWRSPPGSQSPAGQQQS